MDRSLRAAVLLEELDLALHELPLVHLALALVGERDDSDRADLGQDCFRNDAPSRSIGMLRRVLSEVASERTKSLKGLPIMSATTIKRRAKS